MDEKFASTSIVEKKYLSIALLTKEIGKIGAIAAITDKGKIKLKIPPSGKLIKGTRSDVCFSKK